MQLPRSVREWYSHPDAERILACHSNNDLPIPVAEFELERWNARMLLPFKYENQGVCMWSLLFDGSDDPPVYVNVDDNGWQIQAATFSDYIYSCVWDYAIVFAKAALVQAQNDRITEQAIHALRANFIEQLQTHGWPGSTQYRFERDRQAILIWSGESQADWFVADDNAASLHAAVKMVWQLDTVGDSFYSVSEIGKTVLKELKRGHG